MKNNTIEKIVSDTILQKSQKIEVNGTVYNVASPTLATLIEVSKLISLLPSIKLDSENYIYESLSIAKDVEIIGKILATLILGVTKYTNYPQDKKSASKWLKIKLTKNKYDKLASCIIETMSPKEIEELLVCILKTMELNFFFQTFTSLLEINLLRKTRQVV